MERTIGSVSGEVPEHPGINPVLALKYCIVTPPGHLPENPPRQSDDMHMEFQGGAIPLKTCFYHCHCIQQHAGASSRGHKHRQG